MEVPKVQEKKEVKEQKVLTTISSTPTDMSAKLKEMSKKTAISSDDFLEKDEKETNFKSKLGNMKEKTAISSSDMYDEDEGFEEQGFGSQLKNLAVNFTLTAAEKAKKLQGKATDLYNKYTGKQ